MSEVKLEDIVSLAKRRGFVYPGSDIYGGLAGVYDYGPLGVALKRNIQKLWLKNLVEGWDGMYQIDSGLLMNKKVWEASGHVSGFNDPLVECSNCHSRLRADHIKDYPLYDDDSKYENYKTSVNGREVIDYEKIKKEDPELYKKIYKAEQEDLENPTPIDSMPPLALEHVKCPVCGKEGTLGEPRQFNMMFKTTVGTVEDENNVTYLPPETAQSIFVNYKNILDSFSPDMPFAMAQIGKAFRNEISPREFLFRVRDFELMEIEYFCHPDNWEKDFEQWRQGCQRFFKDLGLPESMVHELEVPENDRAHYSNRTIDFEFDFPFGRRELMGLAYRGDYDLKKHQEASGKNLEYRPKDGSAAFIPHVIEPSVGTGRLILAVLTAAYSEDEQGGEKRVFLKLPDHLAPYKVAVSPLLRNKPELVDKAKEVYKMLQKEVGNVMWIDTGNVGKNYRRADEIGTPYCVTIDFQTLEDDTVTVRSRDTTEQRRVGIQALKDEMA